MSRGHHFRALLLILLLTSAMDGRAPEAVSAGHLAYLRRQLADLRRQGVGEQDVEVVVIKSALAVICARAVCPRRRCPSSERCLQSPKLRCGAATFGWACTTLRRPS